MGAVTPGRSEIQLSATCEGVAPVSVAMRVTASMIDQLRSESAYSSEMDW
jgi:hypothetical protein